MTWDAVVTAALLGTERSGAERPAPAGSLGALVARLERGDPDDAERALLGQMGVLAVHRRAGRRPRSDDVPSVAPAPADDRPEAGLASP